MLPIRDLLNPLPETTSAQDAREQSPTVLLIETSQGIAVNAAPRTPASRNNRPYEAVRYPPFENINDESLLQEMARFRVTPFKGISDSCEHVPYNSAKKDLFEKTGRESIELFRYNFRRPSDGELFTVMWDYHIGLVRLTPFFKCLNYSKTRPSQMLDKNPGLRNLCPSITGGSVSAQGYWMPYRCARAMCTTFCYEISGALVPLFGPTFPADCTHPRDPRFGEMRIDPGLITICTAESHRTRAAQLASNRNTNPTTRDPRNLPNLNSLRQYIMPDGPITGRSTWRPINTQETTSSLNISPRDVSRVDPMRRPLLAERPSALFIPREGMLVSAQSQSHHNYSAPAAGSSRYGESWTKRRRTPEDLSQVSSIQTEQPSSYRQQKKSRGDDTASSSTLAELQQRPQAQYPR